MTEPCNLLTFLAIAAIVAGLPLAVVGYVLAAVVGMAK